MQGRFLSHSPWVTTFHTIFKWNIDTLQLSFLCYNNQAMMAWIRSIPTLRALIAWLYLCFQILLPGNPPSSTLVLHLILSQCQSESSGADLVIKTRRDRRKERHTSCGNILAQIPALHKSSPLLPNPYTYTQSSFWDKVSWKQLHLVISSPLKKIKIISPLWTD